MISNKILNPNINDKMLNQKSFTIKDFAVIVQKDMRTIRSWEDKGICDKPPKNNRNWREYSPIMLAHCLEQVIDYDWKRRTITNMKEIRYIIDRLKNKKENEK